MSAATVTVHRGRRGRPPAGFRAGDPVLSGTSIGPVHATEGLAGYPARDYMAPAGSPAVAPVSGTIARWSGHDPAQGPVAGPHGPLGWSIYLQGDDGHSYYLTHLGSRSAQVGQRVTAGQQIGTVADYAKYGTPSHIHMGVSGAGASLPAGGSSSGGGGVVGAVTGAAGAVTGAVGGAAELAGAVTGFLSDPRKALLYVLLLAGGASLAVAGLLRVLGVPPGKVAGAAAKVAIA